MKGPGRTLADFEPLSEAERKLRDEVGTGQVVVISGGVPEEQSDAVRIRASFIRYLLLGGCPACRPHEKGVRVRGAFVAGDGPAGAETRGLDLEGCTVTLDLGLLACHIPDTPLLRSAQVRSVNLNGSLLANGLSAEDLDAKGDVDLRGATATVEVSLLGATLGCDLVCTNTTLTAGESGKALIADGLNAKGTVFLSDAIVTGEVRLLGATLGGVLDCHGATLTAGETGKALSADRLAVKGDVFLSSVTVTGEVRLPGATLGGDLSCIGAKLMARESGNALNATNARVGGAFLWRQGASADGLIELTAARFRAICDDLSRWPDDHFILERCSYEAFVGTSVSGTDRAAWLGRQHPVVLGCNFSPQPWEQCAKVLRETGHPEDARFVLIEKERRQREAKRQRLRSEHLYEDAYLRAVADAVLGATVRYGRQPLLAFAWLLGFWLVGVWAFATAAADDAVKPNNAVILRSPEWVACHPDYRPPLHVGAVRQTDTRHRNEGTSQLACFLSQDEAASYPRFNAALYSLDTLLPIVSMEMQGFWIPDERAEPVGKRARWYLWIHIGAGWALSLLAVAGFSGLVKSD